MRRFSKPLRTPRRLRRRPLKSLAAAAASGSGSRRSGSATPLLHRGPRGREERAEKAGDVSVRRIAAAVWRLRPPGGGLGDATSRLGLEHIPRHLQVELRKQDHLSQHHEEKKPKNEISSPISVLESHGGELHKVQVRLSSAVPPVTTMENATKWEPESIKGIKSDDAYMIAGRLDLIDKQQGANYVSNIHMELQQTRYQVSQLEAKRLSAEKKIDDLFEKLVEEKAAWQNREHKKAQAIVENMKTDLEHEQKKRRWLESINLKLVNELKDVTMSAKQLLQEYENERKARELMEEVCNELVREVQEDKAEIEALKQDILKQHDEVDKDRTMLQMAEVWREERVQMKLIDAKLTLEAKYTQLSKLQQDVEAFIATLSAEGDDSVIAREAYNVVQVIESVRAQEVEFTYEPPSAPENVLSIFEELRPSKDPETKTTEPWYKNNSVVYESEIQQTSPRADIILENPAKVKVYHDESESETEDASSWETVNREETQGSGSSQDRSEPSVNKICGRSISWTSGSDSECEEDDKLNDERTSVYLMNMEQHKKKELGILKLWKSSCPKNSETYKKEAIQTINGRSSNVSLSNSSYSPTDIGNEEIGPWSSPDSTNIQLNRASNGCIECPQIVLQKQSLKERLLEAKKESPKIQIRHLLKQKV